MHGIKEDGFLCQVGGREGRVSAGTIGEHQKDSPDISKYLERLTKIWETWMTFLFSCTKLSDLVHIK